MESNLYSVTGLHIGRSLHVPSSISGSFSNFLYHKQLLRSHLIYAHWYGKSVFRPGVPALWGYLCGGLLRGLWLYENRPYRWCGWWVIGSSCCADGAAALWFGGLFLWWWWLVVLSGGLCCWMGLLALATVGDGTMNWKWSCVCMVW